MTIVMNKARKEIHPMPDLPSVLITGASSGIGAVYADRFARRGHDLVLVARDDRRMETLASALRAETGVSIEVVKADLTQTLDLEAVSHRLREDNRIGVLINNAGAGLSGQFADQSNAAQQNLIALNVSAVVALAHAVAPRFAQAGSGAIVNIGSVVGLAPEFGMSVYGATKAFVLYLSQGLAVELGPRGVYVQAVVPSGTRTEIWDRSGADPANLPPLMEVADLVDAALVGFDRREPVTVPPLHDAALWDAFQGARQAMLPGFAATVPADRYRA